MPPISRRGLPEVMFLLFGRCVHEGKMYTVNSRMGHDERDRGWHPLIFGIANLRISVYRKDNKIDNNFGYFE